MGRRGPLPKPKERLAGHRQAGPALELVSEPSPSPEPPAELSEEVATAWEAYWRSDVARVASEVDLPVVRRLFRMYEQYEQALEVVRKAIVVRGSTGQIRVNPLADYAFKLSGRSCDSRRSSGSPRSRGSGSGSRSPSATAHSTS